MPGATIRLLEPVPWRPGLVGEFPGQQCFIELGADRVPMIFCWCPPTPPGQPFLMGSPPDEADRYSDERQRPVEIPRGFWLAQHPVNQQQWQAVMGTNPSRRGHGPLYPVDSVSWNDAQEFCRKAGLRLPTEAEWEYACRAGTTTPFGIGSGHCLNSQMANFNGNHPYGSGREAFKWLYRERTLPQGSFPPNAWGFHDMHGQLWEWCEEEVIYEVCSPDGSSLNLLERCTFKILCWIFAQSRGSRRREEKNGDGIVQRKHALRGGSWNREGKFTRGTYRLKLVPEGRVANINFRPCLYSSQGPERPGGTGPSSSSVDPPATDETPKTRGWPVAPQRRTAPSQGEPRVVPLRAHEQKLF